MKDLFSFLNEVSGNSDFKATLSERGGFITFSNSGRRGGSKFFQIGLDNILQTLKDILINIETFKNLTEYDETSWRNNGLNISRIQLQMQILQFRLNPCSQH